MEVNLGIIITFTSTLLINAVMITIFILRMEGKINLLTAQLTEYKTENKELRTQINSHRDNQEIHFSLAVSNQVQKRTDEKFDEIERQLSKMDSSFNDKFREIRDVLNKMLK